ncbi:hypothetical protein [Streptococcus pyogenes]|uniref:hypothetical protein n=1 Tax=Streptococcus pyogenes TaxID=1314 RepID=UPI0008574247|nr:hypothetical protein [Streptococcus pyogenes]BAV54638.1 hypothetical protein JMUB1235_0379 [Streptococcus pyogenes]HEQ2146319.1 hypothetical protein [Streptococcus pyogenes]HEQ2329915.1 hypothetical protein [Streptococcus pyogenes]HER3788253.1 hypothetical protein [Streptococcus pyogenes]HER3805908.1 hypothetical protein [Streptococcus pyogenes]
MKTKSKRFLNLATLYLALLGTTLLMGRPVNADNADMDGYGSESKVQREQSPYEKGVRDGHDAGYKQGKQDRQQGSPDASPTPPDKLRVPEPESNPYNKDHDKQNNQRYKNGWDIAYRSSYYTGWYSAEGTGHLESDDYPNEEEGEDISDNSPSQGSTGSTDDGFSNLIDMVVYITTFLWGLVSNWF